MKRAWTEASQEEKIYIIFWITVVIGVVYVLNVFFPFFREDTELKIKQDASRASLKTYCLDIRRGQSEKTIPLVCYRYYRLGNPPPAN